MSIIVKLPRAHFTAGRVSTDELAQILHQGLWKKHEVLPAQVSVSLHEGTHILSSGCSVEDVEEILNL
ncbi:hypothetical protein [Yersinia alsatica]|uniref:hypothetical protein n=1 Tax=Yersinia alsatica TaxID=2890317 RepID=UPI0011A3DE51|nr:hypothetical protein [Yersinia alsatica]